MPFLCIIISLLFHAVHTTLEKNKKKKKFPQFLILDGILSGKENNI